MGKMPISERPLAFIDVETSGLDVQIHEILEIAIIHSDGREYTTKVQPNHIESAEVEALGINGYNPDEWADAPTSKEVAPKVANLLADCILIGQNVRFDAKFVEKFHRRNGVDIRFDYHIIDTATLIFEHLVPCGLESLSLNPACAFLGIETEEVHRAHGGAIRAKLLYEKLMRATVFHRWWWRLGAKNGWRPVNVTKYQPAQP